MDLNELKQEAKKYLAEHSEYSEVFGETFVAVDTLTAMVDFAESKEKRIAELEASNKEWQRTCEAKSDTNSQLVEQLADKVEKIATLERNVAYYAERAKHAELDGRDYVLKNKDLGKRCLQLQKDKGNLTDRISDLEEKLANADYQLEGRDLEIKELEAQIEKMKMCQNCKSESKDYTEKPCCNCSRCLGDIKREGNSDNWELAE